MNYLTYYDYLYSGSNYLEGATKSTAGKGLFDGNIDNLTSQSPSKIRKQTHYLNANNTDIPAIVAKSTSRTIGVNVNIKVTSPDKGFNADAEKFLAKFNKLNVGELTGKHHGNSAYRAISDFDMLDGGVLIRHHYNTAWEIPYKYELISVDMIDISKQTRVDEKPYTLNGLVYDKWNNITHVWLYRDALKGKSDKVAMSELTYYSDVWLNLGQQTAISKLSSLLPTIDQLSQYSKAELDNAIESAKSGAYLKSTAYNEIMMLLKNAISDSVGSKTTKDQLESAYDFAKPILDRLSSIGVKPYGLTPIPSEDDVIFDTKKRDGVYQALNDNAEMKMGASLGMSGLSVYSKADKVNYSAMKYVSETDQLTADIRFDNLSAKVFDAINTRAIQVGVQIGSIRSRVKYWSKPSDYNAFTYLRQIHIDIEPSKNAQANQTNIENGIDTEANIIEKREGIDYSDWLEKTYASKKLKIKKDLELEKYKQDLKQEMGIIDDNENNDKVDDNE